MEKQTKQSKANTLTISNWYITLFICWTSNTFFLFRMQLTASPNNLFKQWTFFLYPHTHTHTHRHRHTTRCWWWSICQKEVSFLYFIAFILSYYYHFFAKKNPNVFIIVPIMMTLCCILLFLSLSLFLSPSILQSIFMFVLTSATTKTIFKLIYITCHNKLLLCLRIFFFC